jgi:hypothetical protein
MSKISITVFAFLSAALLHAQSAAEIRTLFPGEHLVFKENTVHYTFNLQNGEPYAESREIQELLFLSPNAVYMSRFGFYHSSFNELREYEAYTITPEGKKVPVKDFKTTESRSRSVFYDDIKETSFNFPSVTDGSTGHLEVTSLHKNLRLLPAHYFSQNIPVLNGELKITFPKDWVVKYRVKGNNPERVIFSEEKKKRETVYTFRISRMEKDQNYPDAPDNSYYALHVAFYIESITDEKGQQVKWLGAPEDLFRFYRGFISHINKDISPELKTITDSLVNHAPTDEAKARNIYSWVQQHIKYVAFENGMEGFIPRDANLVCSRRYGDCKDMASILTKMLQYAGVPAYFTWIGTRSLPYDYSELPLPIVDNHMIAAVKLDTGFVFLDGTDSHGEFGVPPDHIQGKEALVVTGENDYKIIRVPVMDKEKNFYTDTTILRMTEKGIQGTIKVDMSGYFAINLYRYMNQADEKDREKFLNGYLSRGSNKFRLGKYEIVETGNPGRYSLVSQFELQDFARKVAGEWYLNLNLFKFYEHQEIDYPRRKMPVEFDFKNERRYVTILEIPEGYKLSYLPPGKSFHNEVWGFDLQYEEQNNRVILTQRFENNHLLLPVEKFQAWNKVLENLLPAYKETISLSKK